MPNHPGQVEWENRLHESLTHKGLRYTRQRQHVFEVLMNQRDHPTVDEVHQRARAGMSDISLATVYNCLDALVSCDLVREVNLDREPTRYCPNMHEHGHFHCDDCDRVVDIDLQQGVTTAGLQLPRGYKVKRTEVTVRGVCPECQRKAASQN